MMTKKLTHTIGYLVKMRRPFEKIKLSQLYILCNILAEAEIRNVSIIKRKYLEKGLSFDETLSLLEDLKLVRINSGELIPSNSLSGEIAMVPNSSSVKAIDSPETLVRVWSLKATAVKRKTNKTKVNINHFLFIKNPPP